MDNDKYLILARIGDALEKIAKDISEIKEYGLITSPKR